MNPAGRKKGKNIRIEESLDPWQLKRRDRLAFIKELIRSQKEVDKTQFLGSIGTEYGIRRHTAEEYLKDLQDYGVIEVSDGKIKWVGKESERKE